MAPPTLNRAIVHPIGNEPTGPPLAVFLARLRSPTTVKAAVAMTMQNAMTTCGDMSEAHSLLIPLDLGRLQASAATQTSLNSSKQPIDHLLVSVEPESLRDLDP